VSPKYSSNTGSRASVATVASCLHSACLHKAVMRSSFYNSNNTNSVASFAVGSVRAQANKREGDSLFCLVNTRLNTNKQNSKNKIFPIFPNPNIRNFSNKQIQKPLNDLNGMIKQTPDLTELNKQIFFPLTQLHIYRKESLLTETSTAYLNSVHPTKLRVNLNQKPTKLRVNLNKHHLKTKHTNKKLNGLNVAPSKTSDVIYEYLKTFSKYSNSQKGVLINFNQHIAYNFNNRNILLR